MDDTLDSIVDTISISSTCTTIDFTTMGSGYSGSSYTISTCSGLGSGSSPSGAYMYSNGNTPAWTAITTSPSSNSIDVKGDANFEGDIKWKGQSLGKMIEAIHDRLAILQPDPAKLEKHAALKKAYDHYKLMEKLIGED
jgi:hypothetical protein